MKIDICGTYMVHRSDVKPGLFLGECNLSFKVKHLPKGVAHNVAKMIPRCRGEDMRKGSSARLRSHFLCVLFCVL